MQRHTNDQPQPQNQQQQPQKCPRCDSLNTKFCYYNNYSLAQPRYFCKTCRRYWTHGGTLRNVPVGGSCRKGKRAKISTSSGENNNSPPAPMSMMTSLSSNPLIMASSNTTISARRSVAIDHQLPDQGLSASNNSYYSGAGYFSSMAGTMQSFSQTQSFVNNQTVDHGDNQILAGSASNLGLLQEGFRLNSFGAEIYNPTLDQSLINIHQPASRDQGSSAPDWSQSFIDNSNVDPAENTDLWTIGTRTGNSMDPSSLNSIKWRPDHDFPGYGPPS